MLWCNDTHPSRFAQRHSSLPPICKHMHRPKHPFWVVTGLNKSLQHIGFIVLDGIGTGLAKTSHNLKGMQGLGYRL